MTWSNAGWLSSESGWYHNKVSGSSYVGPGDIATFAYWYGLRAYSGAKAGTKCIRVIRASDSTQTDINSLSNGALDISTLTTFLAATTGKIVTFYDQVGSADATQATGASQAVMSLTAGPASTVTSQFAGSQSYNATVSALGGVQPLSFSMVAERTSNFTAYNAVLNVASGSGDFGALFDANANSIAGYFGGVIGQTGLDSAYHAVQGLASGTSSLINIDGTLSPVLNWGTGVATTSFTLGNGSVGGLNGNFNEGGLMAGDQSSHFSALNTNQRTFWGF